MRFAAFFRGIALAAVLALGGCATQPVAGIKDFSSRPVLNLQKRPQYSRTNTAAQIFYKNGAITRVLLLSGTGNSKLDKMIVHHIFTNFKVKPGASGKAFLPIHIGR